jgi:hypothetical protein
MEHRLYRKPSSSTLMIALTLLSFGAWSGCGDSASSGAGKAKSTVLDSANKSLSETTKVRGKQLPATSNLSARERRALKQEGQLPK